MFCTGIIVCGEQQLALDLVEQVEAGGGWLWLGVEECNGSQRPLIHPRSWPRSKRGIRDLRVDHKVRTKDKQITYRLAETCLVFVAFATRPGMTRILLSRSRSISVRQRHMTPEF